MTATQAAVKERPILFSAPMVKAILAGDKTQTRRIIKPQIVGPLDQGNKADAGYVVDLGRRHKYGPSTTVFCPYGKPGERLWVRETWGLEAGGTWYEVTYKADNQTKLIEPQTKEADQTLCRLYDSQRGDWRPSIHMPRVASRILLEIVSVRAERLQDISHDDALDEGVEPPDVYDFFDPRENPRTWFGRLWEAINGAGSFEQNPWVWVVEFKRIEPAETAQNW